ncbi:endonuclease/exonuclease/phosphatase superfamily [Holotrichia oblita]|uniref:Endonuclease/exonuclease/phosphatase superfamily n=1 Tax=Holotrichia oblita TaxID=644536 RepID=A0ACB9TA67_HOLOL|nr:endonuclease/exonuclease/phosphatase superfamily [Holotrichia oblita]
MNNSNELAVTRRKKVMSKDCNVEFNDGTSGTADDLLNMFICYDLQLVKYVDLSTRFDKCIDNIFGNIESENERKVANGHVILTFKDCVAICCYVSPNIAITNYKEEVNAIICHLRTKETVIMGDLNSKSPQWSSPTTDEAWWQSWRRTWWFIIHKYIYFEIKDVRARKTGNMAKYRVDWEAYKDTIELTGKYVNHETCSQLIRQAYRNSRQRAIRSKRDPYWWTEEIEIKREECTRSKRRLTRLNKKKKPMNTMN